MYGFVCAGRADRRARQMRRWVAERHPELWLGVPAVYRNRLLALFALGALQRGALGADPDFAAGLAEIGRLRRRQLVAAAVGLACILTAVMGTRLWGWTW